MKSTRIVLMQRLAMSEYPTNTNGQQSENKSFAAWKKQRSSAFCSRSRNHQCAEKTQLAVAAVVSSVPSICFPMGTWPTRLPPARKARCRVSTNSWPKQITLQIQIRPMFWMFFCWTQIYKKWSGFQVSVCIDLKSPANSNQIHLPIYF